MKKFTLIELLVVVAIIGILISILLPSLFSARERMRNVVCMANVQQICVAGNVFAADNDNKYPKISSPQHKGRLWLGEGREGQRKVTFKPLNKYLGIFTEEDKLATALCPSRPLDTPLDNYALRGSTYYGNAWNSWGGLNGTSRLKVNNADKVVLIAPDGALNLAAGTGRGWWRPFHIKGKYRYPYGFIDGAVRFYSATKKEGHRFYNDQFIFNLQWDE